MFKLNHLTAGLFFMLTLLIACEGGDPVFETLCMNDSFEQNDNQNTAKRVDGDVEGVTYDNLVLCPNEEDWFKFAIFGGECLTVSLSFVHADGDLDLTIYDVNLTKLASATTNTNNERASTQSAVDDGDYFVRIFGGSAQTGNDYSMTVTCSVACS